MTDNKVEKLSEQLPTNVNVELEVQSDNVSDGVGKTEEKVEGSAVTVVEEEVSEIPAELEVLERENTSKLSQYLQTAESYETYIRTRSKARSRKTAIRFFSFVIFSTILASIYYGAIATNRYVSTFQFTIESSRQSGPALLQGLLGQVGGNSVDKETSILSEYLVSPVILDQMDEWLDVKGHYQDPTIDIISRLSEKASREEFLEYYRNLIEIDTKSTASVVTVSVQAYDPDFAAAMGNTMVTLSEELINKINSKAVEDALRFSKKGLLEAEERLSLAQQSAQDFQNKEQELDPQLSAGTIIGIVRSLEGQIVQARSELSQTLSFMRPDSTQAMKIKAKIAALDQQIASEKAKLAGINENSDRNYTDKLTDFSRIRMAEEFAFRAYEASLASFELAKSEAARKFSYIVAFVPASLPDSSTEPKRLFSIFTVFLGAAVGYILISFLLGTIKDHIDT